MSLASRTKRFIVNDEQRQRKQARFTATHPTCAELAEQVLTGRIDLQRGGSLPYDTGRFIVDALRGRPSLGLTVMWDEYNRAYGPTEPVGPQPNRETSKLVYEHPNLLRFTAQIPTFSSFDFAELLAKKAGLNLDTVVFDIPTLVLLLNTDRDEVPQVVLDWFRDQVKSRLKARRDPPSEFTCFDLFPSVTMSMKQALNIIDVLTAKGEYSMEFVRCMRFRLHLKSSSFLLSCFTTPEVVAWCRENDCISD